VTTIELNVAKFSTETEITSPKMEQLKKEIKKSNIVVYGFRPTNRGPSLCHDIISYLNAKIPNLVIVSRDIKDTFRLKSNCG
jgi:hypothetical protein